jgi:hypothetical protein
MRWKKWNLQITALRSGFKQNGQSSQFGKTIVCELRLVLWVGFKNQSITFLNQ